MATSSSGRSGGGPSAKRAAGGGNRSGGRSQPGGNRRGGGPKRGKSPVSGARKSPTMRHRQIPWAVLGGVGALVVLVAVIGFFLFQTNSENTARDSVLAPFRPSEQNRDPSAQIPGVVQQPYAGQYHVDAQQRVDYDKNPPFGGPHDNYWAACTGVVYPQAVRSENLVHSLEHGAVWIAYDPARVSGPALQTLESKVRNQQYMAMSPYPGLDRPISLQAWGHQLKLDDAADPRVDQFIAALKQNQFNYPEVGASCDALGPGYFDVDNPPPFEPLPAPRGPNTVGMDYKGTGTPG